MTINERLFSILKMKQLKQADLAKKLNVGQNVITAWKQRGNNPPAEYLVQICEFLDVSIQYLLGVGENDSFENKLLEAYRSAPQGIKESVNKLLDLQPERELSSSASKIG